jgi:hypothetical protein
MGKSVWEYQTVWCQMLRIIILKVTMMECHM